MILLILIEARYCYVHVTIRFLEDFATICNDHKLMPADNKLTPQAITMEFKQTLHSAEFRTTDKQRKLLS